jgi:hypothetical protein
MNLAQHAMLGEERLPSSTSPGGTAETQNDLEVYQSSLRDWRKMDMTPSQHCVLG